RARICDRGGGMVLKRGGVGRECGPPEVFERNHRGSGARGKGGCMEKRDSETARRERKKRDSETARQRDRGGQERDSEGGRRRGRGRRFRFDIDARVERSRYTERELLDGLRRYARLVGWKRFTTLEFKAWGVARPAVATVIKRFGSWRAALARIGIRGGR